MSPTLDGRLENEGDGSIVEPGDLIAEAAALETVVKNAMSLRKDTLDQKLRFAVRKLQLPGFEDFSFAAQKRIDEGLPLVTAVARELIDHLKESNVLDMRSYYAGQVQYELRGVFEGAEYDCEKEEGMDSVTLEDFLKNYLHFDSALFLIALKSIINGAISDGENLRLQAAYLKQIRKHAGVVDALEKEASIDVLTQLWNRAAYEKHIAEIRDTDPGGNYFFLMLDLDKFKSVNDTFGHSNGDIVLQAFSAVIREHVRGGKIREAFRIGGEEMVVVCKLSDDVDVKKAEEIAKARANEIRKGMEARLFAFELESESKTDGTETVKHMQTVSIGISVGSGVNLSIPEGEDGNGLMYDAADKALYEAKDGGRNQVKVGRSYLDIVSLETEL